MGNTIERRREKRLRYNWPLWYAGKEHIDETLLHGRMVNVSSGGAAFTCSSEENCPHLDQWLTIHLVDNELRRIAIQFAEPLPFKPGEQESK
jgi:hypothetical protein